MSLFRRDREVEKGTLSRKRVSPLREERESVDGTSFFIEVAWLSYSFLLFDLFMKARMHQVEDGRREF